MSTQVNKEAVQRVHEHIFGNIITYIDHYVFKVKHLAHVLINIGNFHRQRLQHKNLYFLLPSSIIFRVIHLLSIWINFNNALDSSLNRIKQM